MTDNFYFRIHKPENNILINHSGNNNAMLEPIIIDADSISDFYSDSYINLSWNPIAKQVTFTLQQQHTVRGGYTIFNSRKIQLKFFNIMQFLKMIIILLQAEYKIALIHLM